MPALTMPYTAATTTHYENSYWVVAVLRVDQGQRVASADFKGYASASAFAAGAASIGSKSYRFTGADFLSLVTRYEAGEKDLYALAISLAPTVKDEPGPIVNGRPGPKVSFFESATAV